MKPRILAIDTPIQELIEEILHTGACLRAHPLLSAAAQMDLLRAEWTELHQRELDLMRERLEAEARVMAVGQVLDVLCMAISGTLLVDLGGDRQSPIYQRYFGAIPPSKLKRPALGQQLEVMRTWTSSLTGPRSSPALQAYGPQLDACVVDADAAAQALAEAERKRADFLLGPRKAFVERLNGVRQALYGQLAEMPHRNPELNLARDFAYHWNPPPRPARPGRHVGHASCSRPRGGTTLCAGQHCKESRVMSMFRSAVLTSAIALIPACNLAGAPDEAGSAEQVAASQAALTASDGALLLPSDIAFNAGFGQHLAMDGDTLLAGSLWGSDGAGKVHSFRWNGSAWIEESLIRPATIGQDDRFGASIALQGDTAAIAAIGDGPTWGAQQGTVFILQHGGSTWTEVTRLASPTPTYDGWFGDSLALDGNTLLVGAPGENDTRGIVYVYDRDPITGTWQQSGQITAPVPGAEDGFGDAVALDGTLAVIAAPTRDAGAEDSGMVYAFRRSGNAWALEKTFVPPTPALGLRFGRNAVAVDGDTIAIGNYEHDHLVDNGGAVYVYTRSGSNWIQQARLVATAPALYASVGWSIALEGDRLVAGAHNETGASHRSGAAYVFERSGSTWTEAAKLVGAGTEWLNQFGFYVAMSGDRIAASAIRDVTSVGDSGSVFTFTLSPEPPPSCPDRDEDDVGSYCTPECPCEHGQGDCDDPEDCTTGFCLIDAGQAFGYDDPEVDVCSNVCPTVGVGAGNFCSPECPCGHGQGDCDGPEDCTTGLCLRDAGLAFGFSDREIDVCSNVCPILGNGAGNFCTPECPCPHAMGDCDIDADCRPGLTCVQNVGVHFGQPADNDVCM